MSLTSASLETMSKLMTGGVAVSPANGPSMVTVLPLTEYDTLNDAGPVGMLLHSACSLRPAFLVDLVGAGSTQGSKQTAWLSGS